MAEPVSEFLALESTSPLRLCRPLTADHDRADWYIAPPGLKEAADVAMMLGEPLVLTGAPGAGKTQAAKWLAHALNAGEVLRFDVKSTTLGGDLLYSFDDVGRFRDAAASGRSEGGEVKPLLRYLRFNALGEGILRAAGPQSVLETAGGDRLDTPAMIDRHRRLLEDAFGAGWRPAGAAVRVADLLPDEHWPSSGQGEVRVVLIDELDKAPRDTPNDLLAEVEHMTFLIGELGLRVRTDRTVRPIVVITSNAEKPLPEPFLRRCAYFDVPRLQGDELRRVLQQALSRRGGAAPDVKLEPVRIASDVTEVADLLHRSEDAIQRKPGTAELLAWSEVLVKLGAGNGLRPWLGRSKGNLLAESLTALLKHAEDQRTAAAMISEWADGRRDNAARA